AARAHDCYEKPGDATLVVVPIAGGEPIDLLPGLDRRPGETAWAPDSQAVYFTAYDHGRCPVVRADLAGSAVTRITTDDGAYTSLRPSPDGRFLYALRAAVASPPAPVRIDLTLPGSPPQPLPSPGGQVELPGRLTEVEAAADDGAVIRGWLALPASASERQPAPLLLWVHGGPRMSWNSWSWRGEPWRVVAPGDSRPPPHPRPASRGRPRLLRGGASRLGAPPHA